MEAGSRPAGTRRNLPSNEANEALAETVRAAANAAQENEAGSTLCDAAYASLLAMRDEVERQYPDRVRRAPGRQAFITACEGLPEPVQQCLLPTHALTHTTQCGQIISQLTPAQRRRIDRALGGDE